MRKNGREEKPRDTEATREKFRERETGKKREKEGTQLLIAPTVRAAARTGTAAQTQAGGRAGISPSPVLPLWAELVIRTHYSSCELGLWRGIHHRALQANEFKSITGVEAPPPFPCPVPGLRQPLSPGLGWHGGLWA